jgi:hypothetical protein
MMTDQDRAWLDYNLRKELESLEGKQGNYFKIEDIKAKLEELKCVIS